MFMHLLSKVLVVIRKKCTTMFMHLLSKVLVVIRNKKFFGCTYPLTLLDTVPPLRYNNSMYILVRASFIDLYKVIRMLRLP